MVPLWVLFFNVKTECLSKIKKNSIINKRGYLSSTFCISESDISKKKMVKIGYMYYFLYFQYFWQCYGSFLKHISLLQRNSCIDVLVPCSFVCLFIHKCMCSLLFGYNRCHGRAVCTLLWNVYGLRLNYKNKTYCKVCKNQLTIFKRLCTSIYCRYMQAYLYDTYN